MLNHKWHTKGVRPWFTSLPCILGVLEYRFMLFEKFHVRMHFYLCHLQSFNTVWAEYQAPGTHGKRGQNSLSICITRHLLRRHWCRQPTSKFLNPLVYCRTRQATLFRGNSAANDSPSRKASVTKRKYFIFGATIQFSCTVYGSLLLNTIPS